jgi:Undecaprenyl-phosphate galactose phosphotransferase WbaP
MKKKYASLLLLVAADILTLALSFSLAFLIRKNLLPLLFPSLSARPVFFSVFLDRFYMVIIWIAVFAYEKLYTKRHAVWEETRILIKSSTISSVLIMVAVYIMKGSLLISRVIISIAWLLSIFAFPAVRYLSKRLLFRFKLWKKRVLIIGSTEATSSVIEAIRRDRTMGYEIVGCLTDDPAKIGKSLSGVPILGHFEEVEDWKKKTGFEDIIVTFPNIPRDRLISLLKRWDDVSETIRYIPQTGDLISTGIEIENIGNILSLVVRKNLHKPWNILIKAVFDFSIALALLIVLLPVDLLIAAAIRLDSRGPVFFRQERYGRRGRVIRIIKFRTMYPDADRRLEAFLERDPAAREEWSTFKKLKSGDPRVTRFGAFLRKYSLDELPQIINVLRGEMSLVGPRPYIQEELEEVKQVKSILFQVRPGITGLWQTSGRSNVPFAERLRLDEHYIRNWSLWTDLVLLLKTLRVTALGHGAF